MKKLLHIIFLLASITSFAQFPSGYPGWWNRFTIDGSGNVIAMDSTHESDPTVNNDVKSITSTDMNKWNTAFNNTNSWGNPAGIYAAIGNPYDNPTFVNTLYFNKITSWPGSSSEFIRADGTKSTFPVNSVSVPTRALSNGTTNTFTPSSTKYTACSYTVNVAYSLTLATSNGVVYLEYSTNAGSTWTAVASVSNTFSLAVTLAGNTDMCLVGFVPVGSLVRARIVANTNCTVTITSRQSELFL